MEKKHEDVAVVITHPLESWTGKSASSRVRKVLRSLEQEGFTVFEEFQETRPTGDPPEQTVVAVDTFELLRRPGWIESRLQHLNEAGTRRDLEGGRFTARLAR